MRQSILTLLFLFSILIRAGAQCVPDTNITHNQNGIYPDSATGLPHAIVGIPYTTDLQVKVPLDTVYQSLPAIITTINVTSVTGLPTGFTYSCTPSNCHFPGGSNACIQITCPDPTVGQIGAYPLMVFLEIHGTVIGFPQVINDTNDNYTIIIDDNVAVPPVLPSVFDVSQNHPNPFTGISEVIVSSPVADQIVFKVSDLLGNTVMSKTMAVQRGQNRITLSSADFDPGIYLFTVSNGKRSVARRMIVSSHP